MWDGEVGGDDLSFFASSRTLTASESAFCNSSLSSSRVGGCGMCFSRWL